MANTNEVAAKKMNRFLSGVQRRLRDGKPALRLISIFFHNATIEQFKNQGGLYGRDKWPAIDQSMYERHTRLDGRRGLTKAKIRYGTDGGGKGKNPRRFTPNSKPLQASGGYRMSFKQQSLTMNKLVFGSRLKGDNDLAVNIQYAGGKERMVLPIWEHASTQSRIKDILSKFAGWIAKGGTP